MADDTLAESVIEIVDSVLDCGPFNFARCLADLGGDSMQAVQILSLCARRFDVDLPLAALTPRTTFAELVAEISVASQTSRPGPGLGLQAGRAMWSRAAPRQQALYIACRDRRGWPAYNVPVALWLTGTLDAERLLACVTRLGERHEAFRSIFRTAADGTIQTYAIPPADVRWDIAMCPRSFPTEGEAQVWLEEFVRDPLDLSTCVFRGRLARVAADQHVLVLVIHHAVCDGWALNLLLRELIGSYADEARTRELPPVSPSGLAAREFAQLDAPARAALAAGWADTLRGAPDVLALPFDDVRGLGRDAAGQRIPFRVSSESLALLRSRAAEFGATPFVLLLTAFGLMLSRYSGQDDLIIGVPLANRHDSAAQESVGYFSNIVPVRIDLRGKLSVRSGVRRVAAALDNSTCLAALPLEDIISAVVSSRPPGRAPLFQTAFVLLANGARPLAMPGVNIKRVDLGTGTAKFENSWYLEERGGALEGYIEYADPLFRKSTIARMRQHFLNLLTEVMETVSSMPVTALAMLAEDEKSRMVNELVPSEPRSEGTVVEKFLKHVRKHPDDVAIWHDGKQITYGSLHQLALVTARRLTTLGIGPESLVAVCVRHSVAQVADVLGVLLVGAAFVPLDPQDPETRLRQVIGDSAASCAILGYGLDHLAEGFPVMLVPSVADAYHEQEDAPVGPARIISNNLACVIYASQATGDPRGIELTYDGLANVIGDSSAPLNLVCGSRIPQGAPLSSSAPLWKILVALFCKSTLCLGSADLSTAKRSSAGLTREFGAEGIPVAPMIPRLTEPTCHGPVGYPLKGVPLYILDSSLDLVPQGAIGELYVGGTAVARGYRHRPALTARRFFPDPFSPHAGSRMYRTGDLVRRRADGQVLFTGRCGDPAMVSDYRIELSETWAALRDIESVTETAVVIGPEGSSPTRIVAYVVASAALSEDAVKESLSRRLPGHLVPERIIQIDEMMLTPDGEIDYSRLPAPAEVDHFRAGDLMALLDRVERITDEEAAFILGQP